MIVVKFNTPQLISVNGIVSEYQEIKCFTTLYLPEFDDRQIWVTQSQMTLVHESSIKSVKPHQEQS